MLTAATSAASHVYAYDDAGQLLSETTTPGGTTTSWTVAYTYDLDGNRASLTYPSGMAVDYTYTERNQLKEVIADGPPPLATYTYNANGQRISKALENGTLTTYEYDMVNRLTEIEHSANGTPFYTVGYTLNSVGNRTSKSLSGSAVFNGPMTEIYDYDAIDQLIEADYGTGKIEGFQYDAVGNRQQVDLTESGSTTTTSYTANALNQYISVGNDLPTYDARGNLTSQNGWTYTYDSKNRLLSATDGTTTASFVYDYRNRQVSRTIDGEALYFVWDGWSLMEDRDEDFEITAQYAHGPTFDELLVVTTEAASHYYQQDGLGSTVTLTDASGVATETYTYDAFGTAIVRDTFFTPLTMSVAGNRFTYTGREQIVAIGLMDYRNRVFSTELGRFLQTDPIRFSAKDVNLYRYVYNRVAYQVDPYGLAPSGRGGGPRPGRGNSGNQESSGPTERGGVTPPPRPDGHEGFHHYGNWGGPGWANGGWNYENGPLPREGDPEFVEPTDARDRCYYGHDTCINDCPECPPEHSACVEQCDHQLADCLRAAGVGFPEPFAFDTLIPWLVH